MSTLDRESLVRAAAEENDRHRYQIGNDCSCGHHTTISQLWSDHVHAAVVDAVLALIADDAAEQAAEKRYVYFDDGPRRLLHEAVALEGVRDQLRSLTGEAPASGWLDVQAIEGQAVTRALRDMWAALVDEIGYQWRTRRRAREIRRRWRQEDRADRAAEP